MTARVPVFVLAALLVTMLPGAGQALMLRQTVEGGRRMAWATVAGTCTGLLIWTTATAAGLSAILLANTTAYAVVRIAGGIVLIALGVNTLLSLRLPVATMSTERLDYRTNYWSGYAAGLVTNLGNVKSGVFAISLLPQFIDANGPVFASSVAFGGLWALVTAAFYALFIWTVDHARAVVSKPALHRLLQTLTGCMLLVLGMIAATGV